MFTGNSNEAVHVEQSIRLDKDNTFQEVMLSRQSFFTCLDMTGICAILVSSGVYKNKWRVAVGFTDARCNNRFAPRAAVSQQALARSTRACVRFNQRSMLGKARMVFGWRFNDREPDKVGLGVFSFRDGRRIWRVTSFDGACLTCINPSSHTFPPPRARGRERSEWWDPGLFVPAIRGRHANSRSSYQKLSFFPCIELRFLCAEQVYFEYARSL